MFSQLQLRRPDRQSSRSDSVHVGINEFGPGEGVRGRPKPGARRRGSASRAEVMSFQPPIPAERRPLGPGPSDIAVLDADGRIVQVNQAWRESVTAAGFSIRDGGVGAWYADVACAFLPDLQRAVLERGLERLLSGVIGDFQQTCEVQTPDGMRQRHVQITPLSAGGFGRFLAIHDDQTELATAQEALKVTSEQLLTARDEERQRIAIELHDSTSQHLAAISLSLARLRRASRGGGHAAILDDIAKSLEEAVKETQVLSYLMKPRGLEQNGLSATVLQFLEGFARRTGLEVALEVDGVVDGVSAPLQHAALRIVQEALMNANRHAQARRISVELGVDDGLLKISVADDGHGMPSGQGAPALGVGIPSMQARAQQFSGNLAIQSDESGTRVVALLPLPDASRAGPATPSE